MLPPVQTAAPGRTVGTTPDQGDAAAAGSEGAGRGHRSGDRTWSRVLLPLLVVVLAVPLVLAVLAIREPRWYPTVDDAQTELRVRDVWSADPPLTGLGGRIGAYGPDQGSHPGPLSFWSLSLPYRLLGSSSWALHAASATLHLLAMGLALWLSRRRGGMALLLGVAAALVVLADAYGAYALTAPWNPYLPVLWWFVFLLGVWSLLCGDLPALPVAVFAGSFCMQTHISYVGLVGALGALGALAVASWVFVRRQEPDDRRRSIRWAVVGVAVAAVLWFPPLAEQVTGSQGGNLGRIVDHFSEPTEATLGLREGTELLVAGLDPWHLLTRPVVEGRPFLGGPTLPGTALLVAWAAAVVVSWRLRHEALLRLHLVLAVALAVGAVSVSRIFGPPWTYLALWAWGICALLVVAIAWSAWALVTRTSPRSPKLVTARAGAVAAVVVLAVGTARSAVHAADVEVFQPELSVASGELVPETIVALEGGEVPGGGRDGRYLVTWDDPLYLGSRGYSLFNELDREGFDVGAPSFFRGGVTRHRVLTPEQATAGIHVATGSNIAVWAARPGYVEVARHLPSGDRGQARYEALRAEIATGLESAGRPELAGAIEGDPGAILGDERVPEALQAQVEELIEIGPPVAVFVGAPAIAG